ncbi:hypothetical protein GGX14DRAFT_611447 [Mycena pura]|uniref:F-box domain-containing protein n=1 Tax=Mycena pura TaxID=153505 RepID=A0AAD6YS13_9AGAR|nr:hypothetical protein GGX14DRAFT_611447 [Mycena pura]
MSPAQDAVISTPELLELTLLHLPMRDLLVTAPLVSKAWQALTLTPALQRALFFEPDLTVSDHERVMNPLLAEIFPPFFKPHGANWWFTSKSIMRMPWSKAPDAFKRKEASWRRMLVTQPPTQTMLVKETRRGNFERRAMLKGLSLRMGLLYDLTVSSINRRASTFCVRRNNGTPLEGDLTLDVIHTVQSIQWSPLDERFESDGRKKVEVNFGEFVGRELLLEAVRKDLRFSFDA